MRDLSSAPSLCRNVVLLVRPCKRFFHGEKGDYLRMTKSVY